MILPLYASLERSTRGCSRRPATCTPRRSPAFRKVTWPLSLPGVVAGTLLTFIPAAGDYINSHAARQHPDDDDRPGHRRPVPARARLPARRGAVVHPDARRSWCWSRSTSAGPARRSWSDDRDALRTSAPQAHAGHLGSASLAARALVDRASLAFATCCCRTSSSSLFSFNNPNGRYNYSGSSSRPTRGRTPAARRASASRSALSLQIGLIATIGATVLGTMMAFALGRYRFRGRSATNLLIFMPMATPEVVMGSSAC